MSPCSALSFIPSHHHSVVVSPMPFNVYNISIVSSYVNLCPILKSSDKDKFTIVYVIVSIALTLCVAPVIVTWILLVPSNR